MARPVPLNFGAGGARTIALAPLTGLDERDAPAPEALLERMARPGEGLVHGATIRALTLGDRDRALSALYIALYGRDLRADATCSGCGARYELRFDLGVLQDSRVPDGRAEGEPPAIRIGESRLRLPTIADLEGPTDSFLYRLTEEGPIPAEETAAAAVEAADPALELDLAGTCPNCEAKQAVPFSMRRFLAAALRRDRAFLMREVHLIASAYRWSLAEILGLTRADRQAFARLLIAEREAASTSLRRVS